MAEQPLITIGITCFNAADSIERAIRSAMAQDWKNLDILIVDDCSTDQSVSIIERLAMDDPRIRMVRHPENKGCAEARNSLVAHARGEFIAFFDDDDESMPERVRLQLERITDYERQEKTDLIFCYVHRLVKTPGKTDALNKSIGYAGAAPRGAEVLDYMFWHVERPQRAWGNMGSCTLMARKKVFEYVGSSYSPPRHPSEWLGSAIYPIYELMPFDARFRRCAEWDAAVRLALKNGHFISVDQPLIIQNITPTADKAGRAPLRYALLLRKKYKAFLKARHGYLASIACAHSRFHYARHEFRRSRLWLLAACIAAPHICLKEQMRRKLSSAASVSNPQT